MAKNELFQLRMSKLFKERIRKAAEYLDMNITEYIRAAIREKLEKDNKEIK